MYKKLILSSAIAAALGTAGVAQAAVDLDKPNGQNPIVFAQEIGLGTTGVNLDVTAAGSTTGGGDATANAAVVTKFGFTIGQGTSKYVRLTFDEALDAALEPADFATDSAAAATFSVSSGGAAGDTFVIVEVAVPTGATDDVLSTDRFEFAPQDGDEIVATSTNTRSINYDLYETAVDAVQQTNVLVPKSGQWITWGPGYELTCETANPDRIDVVNPEQFVGGGLSTDVSKLNLEAIDVFADDGTKVTIEDNYFGAGATVELAGSTAAFETAAGITLSSVGADAAPANGTALWTATSDPASEFNGVFAVTADGSTAMAPSSYIISVTDAGAATYDVGTQDVSCDSLQFSGSTDRLDFALTPDGAFTQFARITNPSNVTGDVTVTVYNDAGDDVTFPLGDIAGVASSLEAHGSTKLININDIYTAAQNFDQSFKITEINGTGQKRDKLRVEVRGEFGDDALEDTSGTGNRLVERRADGIYIQGLTVAKDGNAFFQTK